jgi:hypothetical protein
MGHVPDQAACARSSGAQADQAATFLGDPAALATRAMGK